MPPNMAFQRARRPGIRSGGSLRSLGSLLNARSLDGHERTSSSKVGLDPTWRCGWSGLDDLERYQVGIGFPEEGGTYGQGT